MKRESLIGKHFHSYDAATGEVLHWQGKILARPSKDTYLVQLFEWMMGEPTDQLLIPFGQMLAEHWKFYPNREDWLLAWDKYDDRYNERLRRKRDAIPAVASLA